MKEVVDNMEQDVKEILDDHTGRIGKLEIDSEVMKVHWNNMSTQLTRIENTVLQTLNNVIENKTNTSNNKTQIALQVLKVGGSILGLLILGYFAMKGVTLSVPVFK